MERNRKNIDKYPYPESLIRDIFDVSPSTKLNVPSDAEETIEKFIVLLLDDIYGTGFVLRERYIKKKTIAEIAEKFHGDEHAVKVRLDNGRQTLSEREEIRELYQNALVSETEN